MRSVRHGSAAASATFARRRSPRRCWCLRSWAALRSALCTAPGRRSRTFNFGFLTREIWNPVTDQFGALAPIYGTLMTSLIAMLIAVPIGFGIAMFLTELCPRWLRRPIGIAIELLAAVPSIIFGIWGLFVLAPILQRARAALAHRARSAPLPGIGQLFQGPPFGIGVLTRRLVLAIMVLPFIAAVMRDVFETVPDVLKESGYGLGATHLGGHLEGRGAVFARRHRRRHHARARARARAKRWR